MARTDVNINPSLGLEPACSRRRFRACPPLVTAGLRYVGAIVSRPIRIFVMS